jgi:hypothetical protein
VQVIGLFSGIGGMELGFEQEGFKIAALCELDHYRQRVLNARFPATPRLFYDIRSLSSADFHVQTSPWLESGRVWKASSHASGPNMPALSENSDPTGYYGRTRAIPGVPGCPMCGGSSTSSDTPPCRYECEPLTWERPTSARVSGLLPTPTKSSSGSSRGGGAGRVGKWRPSLETLGYTNPQYREWMMGFPIDWSDVPPLETQPVPRLRKSSPKG